MRFMLQLWQTLGRKGQGEGGGKEEKGKFLFYFRFTLSLLCQKSLGEDKSDERQKPLLC